MPGIRGEEEEQPASNNAVKVVVSKASEKSRIEVELGRRTEKDDGDDNEDHQHVVVAEEGY